MSLARKSYYVSFTLEIEVGEDGGYPSTILVDEIVTGLLDDEISDMKNGASRCGIRFADAKGFKVTRRVD